MDEGEEAADVAVITGTTEQFTERRIVIKDTADYLVDLADADCQQVSEGFDLVMAAIMQSSNGLYDLSLNYRRKDQ